ncbi:MAG: hypothetical protein ACJ748_04585 [Flavisolibacter sp.]
MASIIQAQTWQEWFQQKKTQRKYLLNQIAALQVYAGSLEKGYAIVQKGLADIHSIKEGDFNLHQIYFSSWNHVNPKIKSYWKVPEIIALEVKLVLSCRTQISSIADSHQFTRGEVSYIKYVFANIVNNTSDMMDQMCSLITNASYTMTDDQRISHLDRIYKEAQDKYSFFLNFSNEIHLLGLQRRKDQADINSSRSVFKLF